jgi:hypothetical protein
MKVTFQSGKLIVDPSNIVLQNYPLDWINGFDGADVDFISQAIFGKPYKEMKNWEFLTTQGPGRQTRRVIRYGRRSYEWKHVTDNGAIAKQKQPVSRIWRGVYYSDLGRYGRLGGARGKNPGKGRNPNFLNYRDTAGNLKTDLMARDTMDALLAANVNFLFPFTMLVPPPDVTLDFLESKGVKAIFSVSGPKSGQPLPKTMIGIGETSSIGSVWYNYPGPYVNDRHAPGETFYLKAEIQRAQAHNAVIAVLQQDEPVYTDILGERYRLIKALTHKPVFSTCNWGEFYNSRSPAMRMVREQRLSPFAEASDIYCSDPYIWSPSTREFKDFGDYRSNVWRLVDRHRAEIRLFEKTRGCLYDKPRWIVLQGFGSGTPEKPDTVSLPDPSFMFAQIWTAICLGATGLAIYLQHTAASDASNLGRRAADPKAPLIEGISPYGPHADVWASMADAYRYIARFEKVLMEETIEIQIASDSRILTMIKQMDNGFLIFAVNTYRESIECDFDFSVLPSARFLWNDVFQVGLTSVADGPVPIKFSPFQLRCLKVMPDNPLLAPGNLRFGM